MNRLLAQYAIWCSVSATEPWLIFIRALNALSVRYVLTGSVAATVYGEPRNTNDVDIVIELFSNHVPQLCAAFPLSEFYCPPGEVIEVELRRSIRGHFNLIHHETGFKADMYLVGHDPFRRWALEHARIIHLEGSPAPIAPPEYVIIRKLEFYREGASEKHLRDSASILTVSREEIDMQQLEQFVQERHLLHEWDLVLQRTRR